MLGTNAMRRGRVMAVAAALVAAAVPALAQTPGASCGADSLYLYSPESVDLRLASGGRPGVTLSWADLDPQQATCFALADTAGLGFTVTASGGFRDRVDRQLLFTATADGQVGGATTSNLIFSWISEGSSANGRFAGVVNLANNGGFWNWDDAGGAWSQVNGGLPYSWRQVNCVALARSSDGVMIAGMTRGGAVEADPAGLYKYAGGTWTRVAAGIFDSTTLITEVAISPTDSDNFAVGTSSRGLFVTTDGGQNFTQWRGELDPGTTAPSSVRVSAMEWTSTRLVVAVVGYGVFVSTNGGATFAVSSFRVPENRDGGSNVVPPDVRDLASDPANPDRLVAALRQHACYESTDGGLTWTNRYGDLSVVNPELPGAWLRDGSRVAIVAGSPSTIVLAVNQTGLYRSTNDGLNWTLVGAGIQPPTVELQSFAMANVPGRPGSLAVFEDGFGLLLSDDGGATWALASNQPVIDKGLQMVGGGTTGSLVLGTWGGGVYVPGGVIALSETYTSDTSPSSLRSVDLGLRVSFSAGAAVRNDVFRLKAQTFQGWAVWRALESDPDNMTLIGLYDRVNPEDCIVGYCGDESYQTVPRCFAAKRAACFNFATADTIRFFDDEIYNGFGYNYAVSSFDYGNTALASPENNSATLVFSPRWLGDATSPFPGGGNRRFLQVNEPAAAPTEGDEIYAFPNPVRRGAGFPGAEGERVAFTNLPEGASIRIFTAAGDDVRQLGAETRTGGQIYWSTDNHDGEPVAPGVYLYKVEMPQRAAYWGRVVVIR